MEIRDPDGEDTRTLNLESPNPGATRSQSFKLYRNVRYEITLHRTGGEEDWYCWEVAVDGEPSARTFHYQMSYEHLSRNEEARFFTVADHWIVDNRDGVLSTHTHSKGTNHMAGKKATLIPVEVLISELDAQGNQIDGEFTHARELKVAKWENAFEGGASNGSVRDDFIDRDKDRFYIRVPGAKELGIEEIKVATEDCPDPSYNDDPTIIDLLDVEHDVLSNSMILVSDDVDDDYAGSGAGADDQEGDRTHKVQLGGNFVIKSLKIDGEEVQINLKVPVPVKKIFNVDFIRMNVDGVHSLQEITDHIKIVNERYAQVGMKLNATVKQLEWPNVHNRPQGPGYLDIYISPNGGVGPLTNEYKQFIDLTDNEGTNLFFLRNAFSAEGVAITPKQITREADPLDMKYIDKAFVNSDAINIRGGQLAFTPSHELMHLLAYKTDGRDDHTEPWWNLLAIHNQNGSLVLHAKRIDSDQEQKIWLHSHVVDIP